MAKPLTGSLYTQKTREETREDIRECFRKWDIEDYRILPGSKDRLTRSHARVTFCVNDKQQILECTRFPTHEQNLRALYGILESLRLAASRGILQDLARAAIAFLPPGGRPSKRQPWEVLQVGEYAPLEVAEAAYRALAKWAHPDKGGSEEGMQELNEAIEWFRKRRNGS